MTMLVTALLALFGVAAASPARLKAPLANIKNGTISGVHSTSYNQDFFLGIPFAQPPLGNLRFRQAQSLNTTWPSVRDGSKYANHCVGYGVCHVS
jgi:carboxylesterase type B